MDDLPFHRVNKSSWRKTQQYLADIFWTRQYLPLLQVRKKWFGTNSNIKPGDLVAVMDESTKRGQWPKAQVIYLFYLFSKKWHCSDAAAFINRKTE